MGGPVSIPGWLFIPVAFVVLVNLRFVSLVLASTKPETPSVQKKKLTLVAHTKSIMSILRRRGRSVPACGQGLGTTAAVAMIWLRPHQVRGTEIMLCRLDLLCK